MKKIITTILLMGMMVGCADDTQFNEVTKVENIEPKTVFLCQYSEDGELLRRVEFEVDTAEFYKENYSFEECKKHSVWQQDVEIPKMSVPSLDTDFKIPS